MLVHASDDREAIHTYLNYAEHPAMLSVYLRPTFAKEVTQLQSACKSHVGPDSDGAYLTSGSYGVLVALTLCDEVSAFGFGGPVIGKMEHYDTRMLPVHNQQCEQGVAMGNTTCVRDEEHNSSSAGSTLAMYNGSYWHDYRCERHLLSDLRALGAISIW